MPSCLASGMFTYVLSVPHNNSLLEWRHNSLHLWSKARLPVYMGHPLRPDAGIKPSSPQTHFPHLPLLLPPNTLHFRSLFYLYKTSPCVPLAQGKINSWQSLGSRVPEKGYSTPAPQEVSPTEKASLPFPFPWPRWPVPDPPPPSRSFPQVGLSCLSFSCSVLFLGGCTVTPFTHTLPSKAPVSSAHLLLQVCSGLLWTANEVPDSWGWLSRSSVTRLNPTFPASSLISLPTTSPPTEPPRREILLPAP